MRGAARAAAVIAVIAAPALAGETIVGLEHGIEVLDPQAPDWTATTVSVSHTGKGGSFHGGWRRIERFGVSDQQAVAGGHSRLTPNVGLTIEFNASPDHLVLPEFGALFDLDLRATRALTLHVGGRQSRYPEDTATALTGGAEWYHGDWRAAYTAVRARLDSGDSGTAHIAQLDRYYGDGSRVGLIGATGGEATRIDAGTVIVADIASVALVGRHFLSRRFGLTYVYGWTEHGDFYTRQGGALGILFRF